MKKFVVYLVFIATLPAAAGLVGYTATESLLPFVMLHKTMVNPALAAWTAAPSQPCGSYCLKPELDVYYFVPASAQAVVYVFHGGSGSANMWITGEEEAALLGDLVRNQYAVVLLESSHRPLDSNWFFPDPALFDPDTFEHPATPGASDAWHATVNADEQVVRNAHALLGYDTHTPVFLTGFSSGARFANALSVQSATRSASARRVWLHAPTDQYARWFERAGGGAVQQCGSAVLLWQLPASANAPSFRSTARPIQHADDL